MSDLYRIFKIGTQICYNYFFVLGEGFPKINMKGALSKIKKCLTALLSRRTPDVKTCMKNIFLVQNKPRVKIFYKQNLTKVLNIAPNK